MRPHPASIALILAVCFTIGNLSGLARAQTEDSDPKLISSETYSMPKSAVEAEMGGSLVMAVRVDETGKPSKAALVSGPIWPCGTRPIEALKELVSTLSETMMSLRFSPGTKGGRPVEKNIALTIELKNPRLAAVPPIDPSTGKPRITTINGGVLNGKAQTLPKPAYPAEARANRDSGAVSIQVLVDEQGNVSRAGAVSGAPTLQFAARESACSARFSPTLLKGNPVKVSGVITYNFVP